ncbi:MAG: aminopeptidase P family protein [Anaerolineales bacterium]|nr:aminopeptidase P family protein [Anaerolineales bacterium]
MDRIKNAQALMREQGMVGIMIMNHDDYRYFFGRDWAQPRAIIPSQGPPIMISFAGEEPELRDYVGEAEVKLFTSVGEQISDVSRTFRGLIETMGAPPQDGKMKVGMQMWFDTPAFLVDLFRRAVSRLELVPSDPVMDALRSVKEPAEIEHMREAQRIARLGMDRAREMLRAGVTAHEVATEVLYTMMKAGADGTSTPLYVNFGVYTCMLHGGLSPEPLAEGDLATIDLTPQVEGYCANLARTFVLGQPDETQQKLFDTYSEMVEETRVMLKPGVAVKELDARGKEICTSRGLGDYHVNGISHGIGLRFEEIPASTIIPQHHNFRVKEGMTMTIGHTVLAIPGVGGLRNEDVYLVTPAGAEILHPYTCEFVVN